MISHYKRSHNYTYVAVIIFVALIWSILTYSYWTLPLEISIKLSNYLQILTLTIFMITCTVTVLSFKYQNDDRQRQIGLQYSNLTQGTVTEIKRLFMNTPALSRLYFQMYAHDPHIQKITKMQQKILITIDVLKLEHHASNYIFQKMADIYAFDNLAKLSEDNIEWVNVFRSWMQSPILRSHWTTLKYEHHPEFRQFVDIYLIQNNRFIKN